MDNFQVILTLKLNNFLVILTLKLNNFQVILTLKLNNYQVIFTLKLVHFMILSATLAKWLAFFMPECRTVSRYDVYIYNMNDHFLIILGPLRHTSSMLPHRPVL